MPFPCIHSNPQQKLKGKGLSPGPIKKNFLEKAKELFYAISILGWIRPSGTERRFEPILFDGENLTQAGPVFNK